MKITIFGGAQPQPGEPVYEDAYRLGKMLAERGHTIQTGGYIGTMEAASKGAFDAGGHTIGVTCEEIEAWRKISANAWVKEEHKHPTLMSRLSELITTCDAAIALPGGPGTLAEIALMWNLKAVDALPRRPLILVGDGWQSVFDQFAKSFYTYTHPNAEDGLLFAEDVDTAVNIVESQTSKIKTNL